MKQVDPTVLVALVSLIGLVISGGFGLMVAVITNRKEKKNAAEEAFDKAAEKASAEKEEMLRERIALRDEQIASLNQRLLDRDNEIRRLSELLEGGQPYLGPGAT